MTERKEYIIQLISEQKWSEALRALKTYCQSNSEALWAWQLTARTAVQLKLWPLAEQAFQQILRLTPKQDTAYFNLSQLYFMQNQVNKAVPLYIKALKQCTDLKEVLPSMKQFLDSDRLQEGLKSPDKAMYHSFLRYFIQRHLKSEPEYCIKLLSQVLEHDHKLIWALEIRSFLYMQNQELDCAIADLHILLNLQPTAQNWHNLGVAHIKNQDIESACESLSKALQIDSQFEPAHIEWVQLQLSKKDYQSALRYLSTPLLNPIIEPIFETAQVLLNRGNYQLANQYFELCQSQITSLPISAGSFFLLRASCAHFLANPKLNEKMLQSAQSEGVHELIIEQQKLLSIPYAYRSKTEAQEVNQQFDFKWQKFKRKIEKASVSGKLDLKTFSPQPPFLLAYLRRNMLPIMKEMSGFWHDLYQQQGLKLSCQHTPGQQSKLRIGFVSRFFHNHSVLLCYGGFITNTAKRTDTEVNVFHLGNTCDSQTTWLQENVDAFFHLDESVDIAAHIMAKKLDVLIYTDIGMDALTYRLAMHRLAPIQAVLLGHPVTTGLPDIDHLIYYATPKSLRKSAPEHTEHVIILPQNLSTVRRRPVLNAPALTRKELGLSPDVHVYFCPMTLYKIHPDFDDLMAGILKKDPQGQIYMAKFHESPYHEILQQRFADSYPELVERLHFIPWMDQHRFYSMIKASDLVLDNLYFAGGTTIRIVLGLETPYLTLPGAYIRERMAKNIYDIIGFYDLCASSPADYVDKAVEITSNPTYRTELVNKIKNHQEALFQAEDSSANLVKAFKYLIAQYPQKEIPTDLFNACQNDPSEVLPS